MTQENDYSQLRPLSADEPKVKGAKRRRMRVHRSIYDLGASTDHVPPVGTQVSGGGVVTSVSGSTFTVDFPGGSTPSYVELPGTDTTVIHEVIVAAPEGSGSGFGFFLGGGGPFIGQAIEGGGVVASITNSTVTISYPGGVPKGPITLPWVDTTVVDKHPESPEEPFQFPFGSGGEIIPTSVGLAVDGTKVGTEVGNLRTRYELPHPGNFENSVRIQPSVLVAPRNDSTCSCAVFIASWDEAGQMLDNVQLLPGESLPEYRPPAGAVVTRFACSGGCTGECSCAISVKSSLIG